MRKIEKDVPHAKTLRAISKYNGLKCPDKVAYKYLGKDKEIVEVTYGQNCEVVDNMICALKKGGFEGKRIALIGETCPEWLQSYFAIISAGAVVIPFDRELAYEQIRGFLDVAEANAIIMSPKYSQRYEEMNAAGVFDKLELVIRIDDGSEWIIGDEKLVKFSDFVKSGEGLERDSDADIMRRNPRGDMSIMLFTSGTTGTSKCVMLSERNQISCARSAVRSTDFSENDVMLSVLPIHHTYELTINVAIQSLGATVCINDNLKNVVKSLGIFKPTGIVIVPLFATTFHKKIVDSVKKKGKENQLKIGMLASGAMKTVGIDMRRKLFSEILSAFGGNLQKIICGGAAMNPELMKFFDNLGITLCEGYGITECSPLIAVNPYYARKKGSVGPACDCCEARIDAEEVDENGNLTGEIQVRGENVMLGYYKNPEANAEVFTEDGWFRTGDIGRMDKDGYLYITGRCKSVIVLENGKNVFPEEIEEYLEDVEEIAECVVVGRKKEGTEEIVLTAVVYPDFTKYEKNADINDIAADIKAKIAAINKKVPTFKQIRNIEIRKTEFEKTTTRKIKRFLVK